MPPRRPLAKKKVTYQSGEIVGVKALSPQVKQISLKPENPFEWVPGQFVVTKWMFEGKERISDYTIISSNRKINQFDIIVEDYPGSLVGKYLHRADVGEKITLKGPHGRFFYEESEKPMVIIARNIGIAASLPILRDVVERKLSLDVFFFNFITNGFEEILKTEIHQLGEKIDFEYKLVTEEDIGDNRLTTGKFLRNHLDDYFGGIMDSEYYISGASEFVRNIRSKLINFGVSKDQILRELFG